MLIFIYYGIPFVCVAKTCSSTKSCFSGHFWWAMQWIHFIHIRYRVPKYSILTTPKTFFTWYWNFRNDICDELLKVGWHIKSLWCSSILIYNIPVWPNDLFLCLSTRGWFGERNGADNALDILDDSSGVRDTIVVLVCLES